MGHRKRSLEDLEKLAMEDHIIKVAQVIGKTDNGGVENFVYNYYENIDKSKVQFDFLVENESKIIDTKKINDMGGRVILIPPYTKPPEFNKALKKIFTNNKYDIVQANMNSLSVFPLRIAKEAGIKVRIADSLSTANKKEGLRYVLKNILRKHSLTYPNYYFACSDLCGKWLFGENILSNSRYFKVPNAVKVSTFKFDPTARKGIREKYGLQDKYVIGTIGRLEQQKNQMFLLNIFRDYLKTDDSAYLIIIGDGTLYEKLLNEAQRLGIANKVKILTSKEVGVRGAAAKFYSVFDCFVLPSLYEGLPTVGIEAQINSLPCLFANIITKETQFTSNCKFLPIDSTEPWVKAIAESKGHTRTNTEDIEKYDIKYQAERLLKLYETFVEENK